MSNIRNFSIIAHIDHGKSTLADRILSLTGLVEQRLMKEQYLDKMALERERGITIKSQTVRMNWEKDGQKYVLNMIDTPGHVDFNYEVSRALASCEGAILLIDSTQGIEAQTIANLYIALENELKIIPVLNKTDLAASNTEKYGKEIINLLNVRKDEILSISAKTGEGVENLLNKIVELVPPPKINIDAPPKALIFDSEYDTYRGIVTYIKVVDGVFKKNDLIKIMSSGATHELSEVGTMSLEATPVKELKSGEVGYIITGVKNVDQVKVGDTITVKGNEAIEPLKGFVEVKPMVFSGFYPLNGDDYTNLKDALEKLQLNDASFIFEPESSSALGFGFRCGFLGLLHMEIIYERIIREFDIELFTTSPNVSFNVELENHKIISVKNPSEFPDGKILNVLEPMVNASILTPKDYVGQVMELCQNKRGKLKNMEYLSEQRVQLNYKMPLMEIVFDFFDALKSKTKGYASFDYEILDNYEGEDLVKVDILLSGDKVDAFSQIVHRDNAYSYATKITKKLSKIIPRQQFQVAIQAAINGKVIARENVKALRKDVLAKCYGGDITRKRKLLEKQKRGKKQMKQIGKIDIPNNTFIKVLSNDEL